MAEGRKLDDKDLENISGAGDNVTIKPKSILDREKGSKPGSAPTDPVDFPTTANEPEAEAEHDGGSTFGQ